VPLCEVIGGLLELSDVLEDQLRMRLAAFRLGYEVGRQVGYREGGEDQARELDKAWNRIAAGPLRGPLHAELEERRWGPGGRARFADPRPGDFKGRKGAA
jgi:hypothetical protein